jgi:putative transposase
MSQSERKAKISSTHNLPVTQQCQLLSLSRSSAYYQAKALSDEEICLMRYMDALHLRYPFYGARRLRDALLDEHELVVNRKHVRRLMVLMDIHAVYPGNKGTSKPNKAHRIYPYLLRNIEISRSNQAWCTDITYLPMAKGFAYLVAIMDWHSRKVLSWRVSNVMDADFCIEALNEAIDRYGVPEIFNTDQGAQFTSKAFTDVLKLHDIRISMDGKGRWIDNVFIERLWRSVKYEEVYLHAYESLTEARNGLEKYFEFYNTKRKHQTLKAKPDEAYYADLPALKMAA